MLNAPKSTFVNACHMPGVNIVGGFGMVDVSMVALMFTFASKSFFSFQMRSIHYITPFHL